MSYNILKKNVKFSGPVSGTIEGIVDTSTNQTIAGEKTFSHTITSSAGVMLSGSGKVSASFYYGDGSNLTGVSAVPAGSDGNVQFTNGSVFGASSNLTFLTASNTLRVTGDVSASVNVSASAFYGDGSNLTSVTASFVTASNIQGLITADKIKKAAGLSNSGGSLAIDIASNGGIAQDSGLKIELKNLTGFSSAFNNNQIMVISGSGIGNRSVTLGYLGDNILVNASNIDDGTLNNARLPTTINVSVVSASTTISGAFFEGDGSGLTGVTAAPTPAGANTQIQFNNGGALAGDADLTFLTGSNTLTTSILSASSHVSASSYAIGGGTIIDANANISCGEITMQNGVGTLNFGNNQISGSGNISGSEFYGDGHTLNNVPMTAYVNNGVVFVDNPTQKIITSNANLTYNTDLTLANGDIVVSTGNITASGHVSASTYFGDASNLTNVPAGSPTGSNTQIQFNADGAFGASSKFTFATSSATLEIAKSTTSNNEAMIFFHSGSNPFGHGSGSFIHSDSDDDLIIDLNNRTDRDIKFITRADSGVPQNKFVKLLIDGTATDKGVAIGNVSGFGTQDLYVSNTNLTRDTNIKFENRDQFDVILNLSSSTAETTFTNDKSSGNLKIRHDGGNIMFSSSVGPYAEFDAGSGYLFKATKLHYKEVACQLASSLSAGVAVYIPFVGTTDSVTQNFTHKFVAPFDGQIVKIMIRLDSVLSSGSSTLKALKSSDGTEHPTTVMETELVNFTAAGGYSANNTRTVDFTSATFSKGDILAISFAPSSSPSTNIDLNMTIVFAYDELS